MHSLGFSYPFTGILIKVLQRFLFSFSSIFADSVVYNLHIYGNSFFVIGRAGKRQ